MKKQCILFIGAGKMAEAMIAGLVTRKSEFIDKIYISNQNNKNRLLLLEERYGVKAIPSIEEQLKNIDMIVLACPPSAHIQVLKELNKYVNGQFIVSIAAGIGISLLEESLPSSTPVAWVMPNTAAENGESISIFTYGTNVTKKEKDQLEILLDGIGSYEECTEEEVHLLTAITGSAPAFLYYFCEALEEEAVRLGVNQTKARKLVSQMVFGSGSMLIQGKDPSKLREQVTSPGGATAAGIQILEEGFYKQLIKQAVRATNTRAKQLGEQ